MRAGGSAPRLWAAAHAADQKVSRNSVTLAKLGRVLELDWVGQRPIGLLSRLRQPRLPEDLNDLLPRELHGEQQRSAVLGLGGYPDLHAQIGTNGPWTLRTNGRWTLGRSTNKSSYWRLHAAGEKERGRTYADPELRLSGLGPGPALGP